MAVKARAIDTAHVPSGPTMSERAGGNECGDIIVQALTTEANYHGKRHAFDPTSAKHTGQKAECIFIADLDQVGLFIAKDFAQPRAVRQCIEMREQQTIARVEEGGTWGRDVVDTSERAAPFHGVPKARYNQTYFAPMAIGGFEECPIEGTNSARTGVVAISNVQRLDGCRDRTRVAHHRRIRFVGKSLRMIIRGPAMRNSKINPGTRFKSSRNGRLPRPTIRVPRLMA